MDLLDHGALKFYSAGKITLRGGRNSRALIECIIMQARETVLSLAKLLRKQLFEARANS